MGGDKEVMAQQRVETDKGTQAVGKLRMHLNKGELHFHDDANKLKVAVPIAVWMKRWGEAVSASPSEFNVVDTTNKTRLNVRLKLKDANPDKNRLVARLDAIAHIERVEMTDDFNKLHQYSV
jgi:hypothetical protein